MSMSDAKQQQLYIEHLEQQEMTAKANVDSMLMARIKPKAALRA